MSKRMAPADRKASILDAALQAANKHGYNKFRMAHVAEIAECSNALVVNYYKTMTQIRRDVMRAAIRGEHLQIIAVGIALKDPYCRKIDPALRDRALATI